MWFHDRSASILSKKRPSNTEHSIGQGLESKPKKTRVFQFSCFRDYPSPLRKGEEVVVSKLKYPYIPGIRSILILRFQGRWITDPLIRGYVRAERMKSTAGIVSKRREERRTMAGDIPLGIFEKLVSSSVDHRCLFEGDWLTKYCEIRFPNCNRWILEKIFIMLLRWIFLI